MTAIIKAYCPTGTNTEAIERYMDGQGGYTTYSAMGHWQGISEQVVVYECVADSYMPRSQIEHAGRVFLGDNPGEPAFLATVQDVEVTKIYIERKDRHEREL